MDYHKIINKLLSNGIIGCGYCTWLSMRYKGSIAKKLRFLKYANMVRRKKVIWFRIDRLATDYTNAWYDMPNMPKEERKWYITHGYNPNRKDYYGVTPDNYRRYISDFEFYRASNYKNYNNSSSSAWFNNKLNTYYLLQPFVEYMPKHYYYASKGIMYPLDVESKRNVSSEEIIELIKTKNEIAAKKCVDGHGEGFYKLEFHDDRFISNGKDVSEEEMKQIISKLDGYIITDFVRPAKWIREMAGEDSFCVLRVMTIYNEEGPHFERLMARLGSKKAGPTQAGHDFIYIGIDEEGVIFNPIYEYSDYEWEAIEYHPETKNRIKGERMQNMDKLRKLVTDIAGYLPTTPYLIFDIIPTDDSFSILEINSHGQPYNFEPFHPVKESENFRKLFNLSI